MKMDFYDEKMANSCLSAVNLPFHFNMTKTSYYNSKNSLKHYAKNEDLRSKKFSSLHWIITIDYFLHLLKYTFNLKLFHILFVAVSAYLFQDVNVDFRVFLISVLFSFFPFFILLFLLDFYSLNFKVKICSLF